MSTDLRDFKRLISLGAIDPDDRRYVVLVCQRLLSQAKSDNEGTNSP